MNMQVSAGVTRALGRMHARRIARKKAFLERTLGFSKEQIQEEMRALRKVMFTRKEQGESFHVLSQSELGLLENQVMAYAATKQLTVLGNGRDGALAPAYGVIRHNLLSGEAPVSTDEFRRASDIIIHSLLDAAVREFNIAPDKAVALFVWRAGLAFGIPALQAGFQRFAHLGARRDEQTLKTHLYHKEMPPGFRNWPLSELRVLIMDPMLATGNTVVAGIYYLKSFGVSSENIRVASIISAPEGVDQVLNTFPGVKIIVGNHDECLNSRGYIKPGLGDFGDLFGHTTEDSLILRGHGILSEDGMQALNNRVAALAAKQ